MATTVPSIACLGVIGRNNNPLHVSIFPSYDSVSHAYAPIRTPLQFQMILSSALDLFAVPAKEPAAPGAATTTTPTPTPALPGSLGLLHAIDERLVVYGFQTNTNVRFLAVVDMRGRRMDSVSALSGDAARSTLSSYALGGAVGLRDSDLDPVFQAMQSAYIALLQNPFYEPDVHSPAAATLSSTPATGRPITSKRFGESMQWIGKKWVPGVATL